MSSSNIKSVGHDPATETLEVEFVSGAVHQYTGVPRELADQFVRADSVGSFFARNVKHVFPSKRVEAAAA